MISVPFINPLRFKKYGYSSTYNTKFFDEHLYPETIREFEEQVPYYQPFNLDDPLNLYVVGDSLFATISAKFYDCNGNIVFSQDFTHSFNYSIGGATFPAFTNKIDLNDVGEGRFTVMVTDGTTTIESNKIEISDSHDGTVQIKYRNSKLYEDVIFEKLLAVDSTFYFYLRTQGYIKHNLPERQSTTYEDQILNMTALKNVPYNSWSFITDSKGIPDYMIDLLNRVLGCKDLTIEGRGFTIPQDSKWEEKEEENYPLRGWGIDMREKVLSSSIGFNGTTGGGDGTPPSTSTKEEFSDWWTVTPGTYKLTGTATSAIWGYEINEIDEVKLCSRSGNILHATTGTPGNQQYKHDGTADEVLVDNTIPFEAGETVFLLFTKV